MNALAYCQLAVSNDSSRYNLCEVYRAETALYGTDGHRLHFCKGLPATTPHFPSGLNAQFPDCGAVMPKGEPISIATVKVSKETLAMLKSLAKVYSKSKHKAVSVTFDGAKVTLSGEHTSNIEKGLIASFSLQLPFFYGESFPPFSISVNLDYLIDALAIPKGKDATIAAIEFRGEKSPIVVLPYFEGIEHGTIGSVIMPLMPKD
jgi:DNA polymerase III sliding clamp (beta) subunit (PCNA family)